MDTFVIRIWMSGGDATPDQPPDMRGIVEHVVDGRLIVFDAPDQLLAFIKQNVQN
jgi:hypothetical protein